MTYVSDASAQLCPRGTAGPPLPSAEGLLVHRSNLVPSPGATTVARYHDQNMVHVTVAGATTAFADVTEGRKVANTTQRREHQKLNGPLGVGAGGAVVLYATWAELKHNSIGAQLLLR